MIQPAEGELRARFDALRDGDQRDVPDFRALVDRGPRASSTTAAARRSWRLALALAAAAAIVVAVGLAVTARRRAFVPQPLATWTSPTASLLDTPGSALLASPTLVPSALDHLTATIAQREGN